ncbi:unnamed protein product [Caenorhabditis angaria]|uniref:Uncharacterized protein n=1 Tax=Caenorhabditis angaria TaxID=860376 RepID=A0A9P1IKJ6_9PELO|nr:unnamed protein product [Caenorhabditis angaria]
MVKSSINEVIPTKFSIFHNVSQFTDVNNKKKAGCQGFRPIWEVKPPDGVANMHKHHIVMFCKPTALLGNCKCCFSIPYSAGPGSRSYQTTARKISVSGE